MYKLKEGMPYMHVTKSWLIALLLRKERERERGSHASYPSELVFFASGTLFLPDLTDNWKNTNCPFVLKLLLGQNKQARDNIKS